MNTPTARLGELCRRPSFPPQSQLIAFILVSTICIGCASRNVNPAAARANTGYVDIFDPEGGSWSWSIEDPRGGRSFYTEYKPKSGIVRIAFSPGSYELGIAILNTAISKPPAVKVHVADGQLTPVRVRLSEEGTGQIRREHTPGPGRYLRRTKITSEETQSFRIEADVLPSIPYRPKAQVPYALK
jgi:hypothetical protein